MSPRSHKMAIFVSRAELNRRANKVSEFIRLDLVGFEVRKSTTIRRLPAQTYDRDSRIELDPAELFQQLDDYREVARQPAVRLWRTVQISQKNRLRLWLLKPPCAS